MKTSFFFRSFALALASALPVGIKPATAKQLAEMNAHKDMYEIGTADFTDSEGNTHKLDAACRKTVEAELTLPEWHAGITDPLLKAMVEDRVRTFVKVQYVDKFLPVGAHDWATITAAWQAASESKGGFAGNVPADEVLAATDTHFVAYLNKVAPKFAVKCVGLIKAKLSSKALPKALPSVTEATLLKLQQRLAEAAESIPADAANASELATGYEYALERVEKVLDSLSQATLTDDEM